MTPLQFAREFVGPANTETAQKMRMIIVDAIQRWETQKKLAPPPPA